MIPKITNGEGILLHVRRAGEGGRSLSLFTRSEGRITAFISKSSLTRWGTGALFPMASLRYSAVRQGELAIITQYEGNVPFSFLDLPYEEITRWYYAIEIANRFFPEGEPDPGVYALLSAAGRMGAVKNKTIVAFILAVQLLAEAGFDPAESEPTETLSLSEDGQALLQAFRAYRWQGQLSIRVTRPAFEAAARYLDAFILQYGEVELNTRGAFVEIKN